MASGLIGLLILILIVGIVAWLCVYLIDLLPMEGRFKTFARALVMVIAVIIVLIRALALLGVAV